ncbi:MAG TPA: RDD family protein [Egicoccus sp.]|nr:RDD family protein [Egicoccus sp.]HSK24539.1 RDD family protein [Egicoccus sp.]
MHPTPGNEGTVTPEGVELDLEFATIGSRGIAYLLDLLIVGLLLVALGIAEATFGFGGFVPGWIGIVLLLLLVFVVQFGYPIGFETLWRGRTPGKAAMGLRVVTTEGAPVGLRHATVRAVVGLVELLPTLGVPAVVTSLLNARGQRLGDLAAGTVVLREHRGGPAPVAHRFAAPPGLEDYVAHLDVSRVDARTYATVRDTLLRLPELGPPARLEVAEVVADSLLDRVGPPPPVGVPAEIWLACVAAAIQRRRAPAPTATGRSHAGRSPAHGTQRPVPRPRDGGDAPPQDGFAPPG